MSFLAELKRRNVIRMAGLYLVGAWLIVQVAGTVLPMFAVPAWVARAVVIVLALGFVPALIFSWVFELTPQGLRRDDEVPGTASIAPQTARRMDRMIIVVLLLALTYFGFDRLVLAPRRDAALVATATRDATVQSNSTRDAVVVSEKSIAVLPFVNMSADKDNEYFSDGISEEILNALAKIDGLKVAGRTSSFVFKDKNESLKRIGSALDVAHVLEGSVRKQGARVRITAQLIRAKDGFHLWSEAYDGDLEDVFALQERIARAITDELKIVLSGDQQSRLVNAGTADPEAYALFLQATAIYNRREADMAPAVAALEEALQLDPTFARAQARLAAVQVVWTDLRGLQGQGRQRLDLAEGHAHKAIALDGKLAEPWAVLGRSYGEQRRFLEARDAYAHALRLEPDDAITNYWFAVALISTGYTREGRERLDRSLELDPMQPNAYLWVGLEALYAGELEAAQRAVQRAVDTGLSFAEYGQADVAHARGDHATAVALMTQRYVKRLGGCGIGADDAKRVLVGTFGGDAPAQAFALATIERCLATRPDPTPFSAVKSLMYIDQPARVLAAAQPRLTNNETFLFQLLWSPYGKSSRRLPEFAEFARATGLADVWEKYGPPDHCRRRAERDYVCQ